MNAQEIRKAYLQFFADRGHVVIPRARLVPDNDPTTLFTGSGMQPLLPYLLGEAHPKGNRLVDSQTCLRAQDIEEVGDNRHTTFFEMLGNWSLGDYFKVEQLPWFWEFLTDVVGLDPQKLYVTAFIGDDANGIPKDTESAEIWQKLFKTKGIEAKAVDIGSEADGYTKGMQGGRIFFYDASKNWWCRAGKIADMPAGEPGGPDSEVFYEFDFIPHDPKWGEHCHPNCDCGRFLEIGNSVFMEYVRTESGFEKLPAQNVDFGGGLERIAAAQMNTSDMFKSSIIWPIIEKLEAISGKTYDSHTESMRVIADHLRAATFLAVDGVTPSNKEQGYVMRRLLRRAIRFAFELGIEQNFLEAVVSVIADIYEADFPEVRENRENVIAVLVKEEKTFRQTLRKGLKELERLFASCHSELDSESTSSKELASNGSHGSRIKSGMTEKERTHGEILFTLYDTYGFPIELSVEEVFKRDIELDLNWREQFEAKMAEQRARSQTAAKGVFKGGLGGHTMQHKRYHTGTHLLQSALREIFGSELRQHGSNITEERLRFDFNLDRKMTPEEIKRAEDLVNQWIAEDHPVKFTEYPTQEALDMGAIGPFGERYGDTVKVYQMGTDDHIVSLEICGGPHVDHTGQLAQDDDGKPNGKHYRILKEEASSAGIRRIKAAMV
ncbi:MAG: alanine--tRNA ligase-related protein [Candidatus Saccharimonadales bacterium]|nr:alanine--tRNA ligase [Candidatus Saccharibacteria bacterium]